MRRSAPLVLSVLLSACPEPAPRVSTTLDLTVPATGPAPRIPLVPLSLRTQADFDAFEDRFLGRRDPASLLAALELLAASAKPAERPEDVLLLMRLGVLYRDQDAETRDAAAGPQYLQKALAIGTRLRAEAPKSPHTLYLQGYIPYAFLGGSAERSMVVTADAREFASACRDQWSALLAADPRYDGPHTLDHAHIAKVVASLDTALALAGAAPPPVVEPSPVRVATRGELEALTQLARFQSATEGERKTQCRDWQAGAKLQGPIPPGRSSLELQLDLACATSAGQSDLAVPLILRLRDLEGAAFAPCLALQQLRDRADAGHLDLAVRAAGLDCK